MTSRFDLLEERLNQLDSVALSEGQKGAGRPETGLSVTAQPLSTQDLAALKARLIQECKGELATLAASAEAGAERRMRELSESMMARFLGDIRAALEKSAGVMASQAIKLLEEEISFTVRQSIQSERVFRDEPTGAKPAGISAVEGSATREDGEKASNAPSGEAGQRQRAALESLQRNSGIIMSRFDAQLRATLHAFEENTAKQLAANFQKTVQEFLELEARRTYDEASGGRLVQQQKPSGSSAPQNSSAVNPAPGATKKDAAAATQISSSTPAAAVITSNTPVQAQKVIKKDATWRILGLS